MLRACASNPPPFFFHVPQLTCVRAQQTNFVNKAFGEVLETLGQLDLEKFEGMSLVDQAVSVVTVFLKV